MAVYGAFNHYEVFDFDGGYMITAESNNACHPEQDEVLPEELAGCPYVFELVPVYYPRFRDRETAEAAAAWLAAREEE